MAAFETRKACQLTGFCSFSTSLLLDILIDFFGVFAFNKFTNKIKKVVLVSSL